MFLHRPPHSDLGVGVASGFVRAAGVISASAQTATSSDGLSSWNEGPAKQAILDFVRATTDRAGPKFVPLKSVLPPSIRTARFGSSIRSIRKLSIAWTVCLQW